MEEFPSPNVGLWGPSAVCKFVALGRNRRPGCIYSKIEAPERAVCQRNFVQFGAVVRHLSKNQSAVVGRPRYSRRRIRKRGNEFRRTPQGGDGIQFEFVNVV